MRIRLLPLLAAGVLIATGLNAKAESDSFPASLTALKLKALAASCRYISFKQYGSICLL